MPEELCRPRGAFTGSPAKLEAICRIAVVDARDLRSWNRCASSVAFCGLMLLAFEHHERGCRSLGRREARRAVRAEHLDAHLEVVALQLVDPFHLRVLLHTTG